MAKVNFFLVCNKCNKRKQPDQGKSNENWAVYDTKPCECGGEFEIRPINMTVAD